MRIGFTGTRDGMTSQQKRGVFMLMQELGMTEFHHGDCEGADDEAADLAKELSDSIHIVAHPPSNSSKRAYNQSSNEILPVRGYLARNDDIVAATERMIAAPKGSDRQGGGTWYTIRHAIQSNKPVYVVWPNGKVSPPGSSLSDSQQPHERPDR